MVWHLLMQQVHIWYPCDRAWTIDTQNLKLIAEINPLNQNAAAERYCDS